MRILNFIAYISKPKLNDCFRKLDNLLAALKDILKTPRLDSPAEPQRHWDEAKEKYMRYIQDILSASLILMAFLSELQILGHTISQESLVEIVLQSL